MTPHDSAFLAGTVCVSAIIGVIVGVVCRGRSVVTAVCSGLTSLLLFAALEWRFGAPEEWSWQHPIVSSAYLFGPFVILVAAPLVGAALLISRWVMRRKVI
jgi:hypothetical protein